MTAGHATTPLATVLDLKPGMRAFVADMPDNVRQSIALDELGLTLLAAPSTGIDAALVFVTDPARLECELNALRQLIAPGAFVWVAWPDAATGTASGVTDEIVRHAAASHGLIETKSVTLDEKWLALKLMIRKELG